MKKLIILVAFVLSISLILPSYAVPTGNFTMNAGQTTPIITITDSSGNIIWQFNPSPITTVVSKFIKFVNSGLTAVRSYSFPDQNTAIPGLNASKQTFTQYTHFSGGISTPTENTTTLNNNGTLTTHNITVTGSCVGCASSSISINGQARNVFNNVANTTTQNAFTHEQTFTNNSNGTNSTNAFVIKNTVSNVVKIQEPQTNSTFYPGVFCTRNQTGSCGTGPNFALNQTGPYLIPQTAQPALNQFQIFGQGNSNTESPLITITPFNNDTVNLIITSLVCKGGASTAVITQQILNSSTLTNGYIGKAGTNVGTHGDFYNGTVTGINGTGGAGGNCYQMVLRHDFDVIQNVKYYFDLATRVSTSPYRVMNVTAIAQEHIKTLPDTPKILMLQDNPNANHTSITSIISYFNTLPNLQNDWGWTYNNNPITDLNTLNVGSANNDHRLSGRQCAATNFNTVHTQWTNDVTNGFNGTLADFERENQNKNATSFPRETIIPDCKNQALQVTGTTHFNYWCTIVASDLEDNTTDPLGVAKYMGQYCDGAVLQLNPYQVATNTTWINGFNQNRWADFNMTFHDFFAKYANQIRTSALAYQGHTIPVLWQVQTNLDCVTCNGATVGPSGGFGRWAPVAGNVEIRQQPYYMNQIRDVADGYLPYWFHENDTVVPCDPYFFPNAGFCPGGVGGSTIQSLNPLPMLKKELEATNLMPSPFP